MKKLFAFVVAAGLLTLGSIATAHTDLAGSTPANGAVMNHAPEKLELHFTEAVQLLKFSLTGSEAAAVATEFKAAADKLEHFEIALPALKEDSYTVSWSALGADGHLVEKTLAFTVDADAQEVESAPAPAAAASHAH
jgi:methionine-rich copper-binding protein CopC